MKQHPMINKMQSFLINNVKQVCKCYDFDCFDVFIHEKEKLDFLNYAIPTKSIFDDFSIEYIEIEKIFRDNDREIRFEFLEEFAPLLPSLLSDFGLKEEYRIDFMVCSEDSFIKLNPISNFKVSYLSEKSSNDELKNFKLIQELSFNESSNMQFDLIDEKDVILGIGNGIGFIGCENDISVSACQYTPIINGMTELVGVATLPQYRSKGFATAISARATEEAFGNGATLVCLSAADEKASHIYSSIGFKKIATMLAYSSV